MGVMVLWGSPSVSAKRKQLFVRVAAPGGQDLVGQLHQTLIILAGQADAAHGPVYDAGLHVLKAGERPCLFDGGLGHGKFIVAALEVVVAQDAAAHDGQVSVAAHEIVGEQAHKIQQLAEGGPLNLHGCMLVVEHDAVFVVVHMGGVWRLLGVFLWGGGVWGWFPGGGFFRGAHTPSFCAQLALGVGALGGQLGGCNGLGGPFPAWKG